MRYISILLLAILMAPQALAKDKRIEIAEINGEKFYQKDFITKKVKKKQRLQWAMNKLRPVVEKKLLSLILKECDIKPSEEDIHQFQSWTLNGLKRIRQAWLDSPNGGTLASQQAAKIQTAIDAIKPENIKLNDHANKQISQWRKYVCIQNHYIGDGFFVPNGSYDRMMAAQMNTSSTMVVNNFGLMLPPSLRLPEPVVSIGRLMKEAEDRGLLIIKDAKRRAYFFERYGSGKFNNKTADEVQQDLLIPYWKK